MAAELTPAELNAQQFNPVAISKPGTPEYENTVNNMAGNIVKTYLASSPADRQAGETFYTREAHQTARQLALGNNPDDPIGKLQRTLPSRGEQRGIGVSEAEPKPMPGIDRAVSHASGVLARLSPQTEWNKNVAMAHEVYHMSPGVLQGLQRGDRSVLKDKVLNSQPIAPILHAHAIASGHLTPEEDIPGAAPEAESQRVKIGSFYNNIKNPDTSQNTTVDFRAHDIAAGQMLNTGTNRGLESKGRYGMFEEAHNRATQTINQEHPELRLQSEPLKPHQVQATTWWTDKNYQDKAIGERHIGGLPKSRMKRNALGSPAGQSDGT